MCDGEFGEHEITIAEQMFLNHIDQLKRDKNRDVGRIAAVLLEAHVFIREEFQKLQVKLYQGTWKYFFIIFSKTMNSSNTAWLLRMKKMKNCPLKFVN